MSRRVLITAMSIMGLAWMVSTAMAANAPPDLSGIWMPVASASEPLVSDSLPLTEEGKAALSAFDPRRQDSTRFCMPYGTPRNTLASAPYPVEILQRPERLTIIFDRLGDVRRIFLDGRQHPDGLWPSWLGHSVGQWDGKTLIVDTVALISDSILTDQGLPHSEEMQVSERFSLVRKDGADWLRDEITITDPVMYEKPIKTVRLFRRAPEAEMSEGSALCLMDQWRRQLELRNRALADEVRQVQAEGGAQ